MSKFSPNFSANINVSRKNLFLKNFFENFSFKVNKSYGSLNDVLKEKYQNIKWNKYYNKISFFY